MRNTVLLLFIAMICSAAFGQAAPETDTLASVQDYAVPFSSRENLNEYRSSKINVRNIDSAHWRKVAGSTDFSEREAERKTKPLFSRSGSGIDLGPFGYLIWIAVGGGLLWALYFILKDTTWQQKISKPDVRPNDISNAVVNIDNLDFNNLLQEAIDAGDYRLAVRIYFLRALHQLNTSGKIVWKKDKTNRDYLAELFANQYFFDDIRKVTMLYERIWYGEHMVSADSFALIKTNFETLQQKLSS